MKADRKIYPDHWGFKLVGYILGCGIAYAWVKIILIIWSKL